MKLVTMLGSSLLVACAVDDAPEVDTIPFTIEGAYGLNVDGGTGDVDMGPIDGRSCFLTGVGGLLKDPDRRSAPRSGSSRRRQRALDTPSSVNLDDIQTCAAARGRRSHACGARVCFERSPSGSPQRLRTRAGERGPRRHERTLLSDGD
jgi:hypothetical protein